MNRRSKNHTLKGSTSLYCLFMRVLPLPPWVHTPESKIWLSTLPYFPFYFSWITCSAILSNIGISALSPLGEGVGVYSAIIWLGHIIPPQLHVDLPRHMPQHFFTWATLQTQAITQTTTLFHMLTRLNVQFTRLRPAFLTLVFPLFLNTW